MESLSGASAWSLIRFYSSSETTQEITEKHFIVSRETHPRPSAGGSYSLPEALKAAER